MEQFAPTLWNCTELLFLSPTGRVWIGLGHSGVQKLTDNIREYR